MSAPPPRVGALFIQESSFRCMPKSGQGTQRKGKFAAGEGLEVEETRMTDQQSSLKLEIPGIFAGEASGTLAILLLTILLIFFGLLLARVKGWI
jgi:hypothetical protein